MFRKESLPAPGKNDAGRMIEYLPEISLPLLRGPQHACPYLPGRTAVMQYALVAHLEKHERRTLRSSAEQRSRPEPQPRPRSIGAGAERDVAFGPLYRALLDQRFRRSGDVVYRPACPGCEACVPIRIPVGEFRPSRSQRRVWARNRDLTVTGGPLQPDDEHYDLYARYQLEVHDGHMLGSRADFEHFLGQSPTDSYELRFRLAGPAGEPGRLVGVSVLDVFADALSSVYFYYDPGEARRSLGVYSGLCEIEEGRRRGAAWWYLGYHVSGCRKMEYKAQFRPHELLIDGAWRRVHRT